MKIDEDHIRDVLLRSWDFNPEYGGPFEGYDLEKEQKLDEIVTLPPQLGQVARVGSAVVFAQRGFGKSTYAELLRRKFADDNRTLVGVCDSTQLGRRIRAKSVTEVTVDDHLHCMLGILASSLVIRLRDAELELDHANALAVCRVFVRYAKRYASTDAKKAFRAVCPIRVRAEDSLLTGGVGVRLINAVGRVLRGKEVWDYNPEASQRDAQADLEELVRVGHEAGLKGIHFIMDGVDEIDASRQGNPRAVSEAAATFVSTLLMDDGVWSHSGVSITLFLPADSKATLTARYGFRPVKRHSFEVSWSKDDIAAMLRRRVEVYSDERRTSLDDLCDDDVSLDKLLIESARLGESFSPRLYALLGNCIFDAELDLTVDAVRHLREFDEASVMDKQTKISKRAIQEGTRAFKAMRAIEHDAPSDGEILTASTALESGTV